MNIQVCFLHLRDLCDPRANGSPADFADYANKFQNTISHLNIEGHSCFNGCIEIRVQTMMNQA